MAHNCKISDTLANAEANAIASLFNGGFLRIYDGAQPADANTPITTQNLLAELTLGSPAFGSAVAGVLTANPITADSDANASGNAAWYRVVKSDGVTVLVDGSVGTSGCDCNLNQISITIHGTVAVSSFTHTVTEHA